MDSDPLIEPPPHAGDAVSSLPAHRHLHQENLVDRFAVSLKNLRTRAALGAAAFAASATLLLAVLAAFYSVSSEAVLADSPEARSAVAACDARGDRVSRQHCVRRLVAQAARRDAGASQVATIARRRGAAQ